MEDLTQEGFRENLNSKVQVKLDDTNSVELELFECNDLGSTPQQEQFSLILRGPQEPLLPQMIYPMEHEKFGSFSLFIVPIRRDKDGLYYEAIFNRFPEKSA